MTPNLIEALPERRAERRVITVLFADVFGFTALSETLDPEDMTSIINQFFGVLVDPIYRFGGVVDKYIGDAIMALFGAPIAYGDDAERAVRASWEMQRAAKAFSARLEASREIPLRVRIGLHSGLVVAGDVGTRQRSDYTVMGDTVNLANRLEAVALPGTVLVSAATYQFTHHAFRYRALEPVMVKGRQKPISVYELAGTRARTSQLENAESEFILGRHDELRRLVKSWHGAISGTPQLVVVSGEMGIGKSALVRNFLADMARSRVVIRSARCVSYEQRTTYGVLSSLLLDWLGLPEGEDHEIVALKIAEVISQMLPDNPLAPAVLGHLLSMDLPGGATPALPPRQLRTAAFLALGDLALSQASLGPLVVSLEDWHFADEASAEWLRTFIRRFHTEGIGLPIMVICQLLGPDIDFAPPEDHEMPHICHLQLGPIPNPDGLLIGTVLLGVTPDAVDEAVNSVLSRVVNRAEGNPFYLTELIRTLIEDEVLVRHGPTWRLGRVGGRSSRGEAIGRLPKTVRAAVAARFDRLAENLRKLLQLASVLGRRFSYNTLAAMARHDPAGDIGELCKLKLFYVQPDLEVGFVHPIFQEVAYESLLISQRRELHLLAGHTLERAAGSTAGQIADTLALHFGRADEAAKACHYALVAGKRASASFANADAKAALEEALGWWVQAESRGIASTDLPSRADLLVELSLVEMALGHLEWAIRHLDEAQTQSPPSARSRRAMGDALELLGDLPGARRAYEHAIELGRDARIEAARARAGLGNVYRRLGDFSKAVALSRQAEVELEVSGCKAEAAYVNGVLGICLQALGDPEGAMLAHLSALQMREEAGDSEGIARSLNNLGIGSVQDGRWGDARNYYARSLLLFRRIGNRRSLAMVLNNLADLIIKQGDIDLAERHAQEALKISRHDGDFINIITGTGNLAEVALFRLQGQVALQLVDECFAMRKARGVGESVPEYHCARARALVLLDRFDEARRELDFAREKAIEVGQASQLGVIDLVCAEVALVEKAHERAYTLVLSAENTLRGAGMKLELGKALALRGKLGLYPDDRRALLEAGEIFSSLGAQKDLERLQTK